METDSLPTSLTTHKADDRDRTCNLVVTKDLLCLIELHQQEAPTGIEPVNTVLQTVSWPIGLGAMSVRQGSNLPSWVGSPLPHLENRR